MFVCTVQQRACDGFRDNALSFTRIPPSSFARGDFPEVHLSSLLFKVQRSLSQFSILSAAAGAAVPAFPPSLSSSRPVRRATPLLQLHSRRKGTLQKFIDRVQDERACVEQGSFLSPNTWSSPRNQLQERSWRKIAWKEPGMRSRRRGNEIPPPPLWTAFPHFYQISSRAVAFIPHVLPFHARVCCPLSYILFLSLIPAQEKSEYPLSVLFKETFQDFPSVFHSALFLMLPGMPWV